MLLLTAIGRMASADIVTGLEVHYEFDTPGNQAKNSVGTDGMGCG